MGCTSLVKEQTHFPRSRLFISRLVGGSGNFCLGETPVLVTSERILIDHNPHLIHALIRLLYALCPLPRCLVESGTIGLDSLPVPTIENCNGCNPVLCESIANPVFITSEQILKVSDLDEHSVSLRLLYALCPILRNMGARVAVNDFPARRTATVTLTRAIRYQNPRTHSDAADFTGRV